MNRHPLWMDGRTILQLMEWYLNRDILSNLPISLNKSQLPIVLQLLLSKEHRFKALNLLAKYLDNGPWAIHYVLSVGIYPFFKRPG